MAHDLALGIAIAAGLFAVATARARSRRTQRLLATAVAALAAGFAVRSAAAVAAAARKPPEWDFLAFWLYGRVALGARNVYDPAAFHIAARGLDPSASFVREVLDVGFPYPPPSIVLFAPLGLVADRGVAFALWSAFVVASALAAVVAVRAAFFADRGPVGWGTSALLVIAFPAARANLELGQTIALALVVCLAFLRDPDPVRRGVWLALGCTVKPMLVTLAIVPILARERRTLASAAVTLALLSVAGFAIAGPGAFVSLARALPTARMPLSQFSEVQDQSLLSYIVRAWPHGPLAVDLPREAAYVAIAAALVAITVFACARAVRRDRDVTVALALVAGLAVYPQTMFFYGVLLIVPLGVWWARVTPANAVVAAVATALLVALLAHGGGTSTYPAIAIAWCALAVAAGRAAPAPTGQAAGAYKWDRFPVPPGVESP